MNSVNLIGRIGKKDNGFTNSGVQICKISVATNKKVKGEKVTTWHNVVAFNKVAEIIDKYASVGDQIYVQGEITYSTKEVNGLRQYYTNIVCNSVELLGGKKDYRGDEINSENIATNVDTQPVGDEDIPF